jgi:peptidoglycan hydrolase-like protein with peptidoglycan-binding domain
MASYQRGSLGAEVGQIQQRLKDLGLYNGPIDGSYGGGTEAAIKRFQRNSGLQVDGDTGPGPSYFPPHRSYQRLRSCLRQSRTAVSRLPDPLRPVRRLRIASPASQATSTDRE